MNFSDGYAAAEADVIAWLLTQVPVPTCEELAARVQRGDHRERARERSGEVTEEKRWAIPITLCNDNPGFFHGWRAVLFAERLNLCVTDEGALVVIPFAPLLRAQLGPIIEYLRRSVFVAEVGEPVAVANRRTHAADL